jgi:Fur family ferric uptake transcriptional regulator
LVDAGLLRRLEVGTRTFYEHDYGYPQHEHLYCTQCRQMIEFESAPLTAIIDQVCRDHSFQSSGHTLIVQGICGPCNRARATKRRLDLV